MISKRHFPAIHLMVALGSLAAVDAFAQAPGPTPVPIAAFDHLKCYKIKDFAKKAGYSADLVPQQVPLFNLEPGCKIVVPAKLFCIDVQKTNVQPVPPFTVNGTTTHDFLCYKLTCPKQPLPTVLVQDQFARRDIQILPPKFLCAPAIKLNFPTPTPTLTPPPPPTPTATHTPGCGFDPATQACNGPCPVPGEQCVWVVNTAGVAGCDCVPPPVCSGTAAPSCPGPCPNPQDQCRPDQNGVCTCTHPCGPDPTNPVLTCTGDCAVNETCQVNTATSSCNCVPVPHPCGLVGAQCGGTCQLSDESCLFDPVQGCTCVSNAAQCANGQTPAQCSGLLCPGIPGTPFSQCLFSGPIPGGSCNCQ